MAPVAGLPAGSSPVESNDAFSDLRFSPTSYAIGGLAVLLLFVGIWLVLHLIAEHQVSQVRASSAMTTATAPPAPPTSIFDTSAPQTEQGKSVPTPPLATSRPAPVPSTSPSTAPATEPVRPPVAAVVENPDQLTDARIAQAINHGCDWLLSQIDRDTGQLGHYPVTGPLGTPSSHYTDGMNALCVYTLLQCGMTTGDSRLSPRAPLMATCIAAMKGAGDDRGHVTYQRGLRATALALLNRPEDRATLESDLDWLLEAGRSGTYTYDKPTQTTDVPWDNSNTQYGLMGVWSAAEAGLAVPSSYWKAAQRHWSSTQEPDGEWNYNSSGSQSHAMTMAGIASLFVAHDWLQQDQTAVMMGHHPFSPALQKGLDWLDLEDHAVKLTGRFPPYTLYSVARAGLASGFKYFGTHDWYSELGKQSIQTQARDGSWSEAPVDTCFNLLFLARGRNPIVINKARFEGSWANYARDAANLARFASHQLERPLNFQVVRLSHNWIDWTDCSVLYIASHKAPVLAPRDIDNLRAFAHAGGLIFTHADQGSDEFNEFVKDLAAKVFPDLPLVPLAQDHPLYRAIYKLDPKPLLLAVNNGARLLLVHSPTDLASGWQVHDWRQHLNEYRAGLDLIVYACGRREFRNRLDTIYVPAPKAAPAYTFHLARLSYKGQWDPEPSAWSHFSHRLQWQTGYAIDVVNSEIDALDRSTAPIAHLTGTSAFIPTAEEASALRRYVEAGGVLLIDRCGGTGSFDPAASKGILEAAFGGIPRHTLTSADGLLSGNVDGMNDLSKVRVQPYVAETLVSTEHAPTRSVQPPVIMAVGKGHVIYSPLDLTCGLLGINTWGIAGYEPTYAQAFARNLLIWSTAGQPE